MIGNRTLIVVLAFFLTVLSGCGKGDQNAGKIANGTVYSAFSMSSTSQDEGSQAQSIINSLGVKPCALPDPDSEGWYSFDYADIIRGTTYEGDLTGTMKYRYSTSTGCVDYNAIGGTVDESDVTKKEYQYSINDKGGSFTATLELADPYSGSKTLTGEMNGTISLVEDTGGILGFFSSYTDITYEVSFNNIAIDSSGDSNTYTGSISATFANNYTFSVSYNNDGSASGTITLGGVNVANVSVASDGSVSYIKTE